MVKKYWEYSRIYVVLRDDKLGGSEFGVTVVSAFPTWEQATAEASRLNELQAARGGKSTYVATSTKFYPEGRTVGPDAGPEGPSEVGGEAP